MLISKNSYGTYLAGAKSARAKKFREAPSEVSEAETADRILEFLSDGKEADVKQIAGNVGLSVGAVLTGLRLLQSFKQIKEITKEGTNFYSA